jgi:NTP pyrophosphatase (non-canonical NTP hydrolase)
MNVYVVTGSNLAGAIVVHGVHWTQQHAAKNAENLLTTHGLCTIHCVRLDPLCWLVNQYFAFRGLTEPTATQAFLFLTSETGELADAYVQEQATWVRNNPVARAAQAVGFEIADVLMMLTKFAERMGIDPLTAMIEKFQSKGWRQ